MPLIALAGNISVAEQLEQKHLPARDLAPFVTERTHSDMAIYGWHNPVIFEESTQLICVSSSWRCEWL
jgi:hypothetical protein